MITVSETKQEVIHMASPNGGVVQFTAVDTGDMSEIPPDLPAGKWLATCSVKKMATSKDKYPMLVLEWVTSEALTDGNEGFEGARAADFLVFWPASNKNARRAKQGLKTMCEALGISVPTATSLKSWDDIGEFIAELDGLQATIYTIVETRKDNGEQRTKVLYKQPGSSFAAAPAADEDDEDEVPVKKAAAKKRAK